MSFIPDNFFIILAYILGGMILLFGFAEWKHRADAVYIIPRLFKSKYLISLIAVTLAYTVFRLFILKFFEWLYG